MHPLPKNKFFRLRGSYLWPVLRSFVLRSFGPGSGPGSLWSYLWAWYLWPWILWPVLWTFGPLPTFGPIPSHPGLP
jgi:hypothetical protein